MSNRDGFTIVEVVISMVMLAIILTTLAGLTYATTRQAIIANDANAREAAALELVNYLSAAPRDSILGRVGCDTTGTTRALYQRCTTVASNPQRDSISVVTTPLQRGVPPTSHSLVRRRASTNPLCSGC